MWHKDMTYDMTCHIWYVWYITYLIPHESCDLRDFDRKASELRTDDRVWSTLVHSYFFREKCGVFGWQTERAISDIVMLATYIWWRFLDVGNRISMLVISVSIDLLHVFISSSVLRNNTQIECSSELNTAH